MNIFLLLNLAYQVACLGVMSIDMGSEWFKGTLGSRQY